MKTNLLIFVSLFTANVLFAQEFEVPQDCILNKAADYAKYENDVISCFNWLMATPVNKQSEKRKEANAFLLKYISGSPNVSIEIKPEIVTFIEDADMLMIFMGGWSKYALESKEYKDKYNGCLKGIECVIEFYQKNKELISRNKNVEKYIKMKEKNTLEEYIRKNV